MLYRLSRIFRVGVAVRDTPTVPEGHRSCNGRRARAYQGVVGHKPRGRLKLPRPSSFRYGLCRAEDNSNRQKAGFREGGWSQGGSATTLLSERWSEPCQQCRRSHARSLAPSKTRVKWALCAVAQRACLASIRKTPGLTRETIAVLISRERSLRSHVMGTKVQSSPAAERLRARILD